MRKAAASAPSARTGQSNAARNEQQSAPAAAPSAPAKNAPFSPRVATKAATPSRGATPAKRVAVTAAKPGTALATAMVKPAQPAAAPQKTETAKVVQPEMKR